MEEERNDPLVDEQEAVAAAEAGEICGPHPDPGSDPAERPLAEGGEGESEGFELAEEQLERNASHADPGGNPLGDAFTPESESDRSSAEYAEADDAGAAGEGAQGADSNGEE